MKTDYLALKAGGHSFFRMTNQGLDCSLVRANLDRVQADADWFPVWTASAAEFAAMAEAAAAAGQRVTAGQAWTKAALAYHFAQYLHFQNLEEKARAQAAKVECYTRALPDQAVPGRRLEIPFAQGVLPAILRLAPGRERAPVALLVCGSDSSKEEHYAVEREFLARGMSTVSFDGPGQGEVADWMPMHPDYHQAVSAVVDALQREPDVDGSRIGTVGFGFGGKLALGAAAADPRIGACISVSGYYDMSVMNWADPIRAWRFAHIVGVETLEEAQAIADRFTLAPWCAKLKCPVLVMHGEKDAGIPAAAARRIADSVGPNAEYVVVPQGVHCFHNVAYRSIPLMCDWLAGRLRAV